MRQKSSLPWDLLEAALLSLLALALTQLPRGIVEFGAPLGIVLVIFLPGYAIILALFPRASDLIMKERMMLSLVASAIVAALTAVCLSILGRAMLSTFVQALAVISLALVAAAYIRWASLPSGWRFVPNFGGDILQVGRRQNTKNQRRTYIILLSLAAVIVISAFAYSGHPNNSGTITIMSTASPAENGGKKFTEFYILDQSSQATIEAGSRSTIMAGIINREHRTVDYTLRLVINNSILSEKSIELNNNHSWEGPLSYTVGSPVQMQRLDLLLYKDGNFQKPYDERNIWINVSGQTAVKNNNKEESESETRPKDLPENTKVELKDNGGSASVAVNLQNSQASAIEESKPEVETAQPPEKASNIVSDTSTNTVNDTAANTVANANSASISDQKEQQPVAASEVSAADNRSFKLTRINVSGGDIALNFSKSIREMNASDIDQDAFRTSVMTGNPDEQENNNRSSENNSNSVFNIGSLKADQHEASEQSQSKQSGSIANIQSSNTPPANNLSANKSIINPYATTQKFYTRARPGSTTSKESMNTNKNEAQNGRDNNGVYKVESSSASGIDASSQIASQKVQDKSGSETGSQPVSQQSNKNTPNNSLNSVSSNNASKSGSSGDSADNQANKSINSQANASKSVSPKPKTSAPQDEEAIRMAEMSHKIDSWVSTRGMSPSSPSSSYKSDIIQFNSANNSVVLGGQSSKMKKLG
ncbi:MAG: DUF1616 domain-containing protein [Methanotrichaceae archaeon]